MGCVVDSLSDGFCHLLVHGALYRSGNCVGQHTLKLGLGRSSIDMILAGKKGFDPLMCDVLRLTVGFAFLSNLSVVHTGAMEEVGVGGSRLQRGHCNVRVAQFIANAVRERKHERFGCGLHCFSGGYHFTCYGGGEENLARVMLQHVFDHVLRKVDGAGAVKFHHAEYFIEAGFGE